MSDGRTTFADGSRFYEWKGAKFWSVTTIIGGGVPKPALLPWGIKMVAEGAADLAPQLPALVAKDRDAAIKMLKGLPYSKRDRAADLGSDIHAAVEAYILGTPYTPMGEAAPYIAGFMDWLEDFSPEFEMTEARVYNRTQCYAGTLDAIVKLACDCGGQLPDIGACANCDGSGKRTVLIDWKSGKGVYADVGLQLAAYRHSEFIGVADEEIAMPAVDGGAVVHLTPKGYEFIPARCDDEVFTAFLYAREVYRWAQETSKSVLGNVTKRKARPKAVSA